MIKKKPKTILINGNEHPKAYLFHRAYANVPVPARSEICCVVGKEPMSWQVVKVEVDNKTEVGYKAVKQLLRLDVI